MYQGKVTLSDGTVLEKVGSFDECLKWAMAIKTDIDYNIGIDIREVQNG